MAKDLQREVRVNAVEVKPGYLYDELENKYYRREDEDNIQCKECPIRFQMECWDMDLRQVEFSANLKRKWPEDLRHDSPVDAILVRGIKVSERKGVDVPLDYSKHTVTSVFNKSFVDMLVVFKEILPKEVRQEFLSYLRSCADDISESHIPLLVLQNFKIAYVYPSFTSPGKRLDNAKHAFTEFCRALKDSKLSTIPITAYITGPREQCADTDDQYHKQSESSFSAQGTHKSTASTISTNPSTVQESNKTSGETVVKSTLDEVPDVHLSTKCSKEVEPDRNICCDTETQFLKSDNDEESKISGSTGCPELGGKDKTSRNGLSGAKKDSSNLKPSNRDDITPQKPSITEKHNNLASKDNYNKHKSSSQYSETTSIKDNDASVVDENIRHSKTDNENHYIPNDFDKTLKGTVTSENTKLKSETLKSQPIQAQEGANLEYNEKELGNYSKSTNNVLSKERSSIHPERKCETLEADASDKFGKGTPDIGVSSAEKRPDKKDSENVLQKQQKRLRNTLISGLSSQPDNANSIQRSKTIQSKKFNIMKSKLLNPCNTKDDPCGLKRHYFGILNEKIPEKVIILLGASGSGKTTLLNFIANYFCDKKSADDELIHVATTLQTTAISAYTFCFDETNVPVTIIDTPGLNDSSGGEIRDHVQALKTFLANAASKNLYIHAIGFVAQAHLVRLTSSERLVMDYVSKTFGENVSEHFVTLITFADTQNNPPVVEAMKNYGVKCKKFLKFNNSALSSGKSDEIDDLDRVYYRTCWKNWRRCLKALEELPALSVNTMKAVQSEIYATTVTEMAEKDLMAELKTFFTCYQKEAYLSKENLKVCELIWELASVVHRLKYTHNFSSSSAESTLIECSEKVCHENNLPPENYISVLSLATSRNLTVSGALVIRIMFPLYSYAMNENSASSTVSKNITEWSFCLRCRKEHRMNRFESKGIAKYIPGIGQSADILTLKCQDCKCDAGVHGVSKVQAPLHPTRVLCNTWFQIRNVLKDHSFPKYPVKEENFLKFLNAFLHYEKKDFIEALLKTPVT